ncbi:MAG TPA: coenzyme F420-0:L-glutamate ligase [Nocardioidaceae bacterium]|nr:coenzyme F420-0:L-glutamate ligase [Nocardioidaceae bacterium]
MSIPARAMTCLSVTGIGEVRDGDDLAALVVESSDLHDGDVVVVTSKVVSKAEGRVVRGDRASAIAAETDRVVAARGDTAIVRTRHGLVMAAAGVDASNTEPGTVVLLPEDPDASARALRERIAAATRTNVAVIVTDTSGRAWRNGQTDIAIGAAGLPVMVDYDGRTDQYGNLLSVTAPAVADEIAGAAELVAGKLDRSPVTVVRGLGDLVLEAGQHGPGAAALVRDSSHDMFGYGAREAVLHAVRPEPGPLPGFGSPATASELAAALLGLCADAQVEVVADHLDVRIVAAAGDAAQRSLGRLEARLLTVAHGMGWRGSPLDTPDPDPDGYLRFLPGTP